MVYGNPTVLVKDANWRHLIMNCVRNGTYFGAKLPESMYDGGATDN